MRSKAIPYIAVLALSLFSQAVIAKTPLPQGKLMIDFSSSLDLHDPKNAAALEKIRAFAREYANEGTVYDKPLSLDSVNLVLNPVVGSDAFAHHFRFNLKASDGKVFNCVAVTDAGFRKFQAGCYLAAR